MGKVTAVCEIIPNHPYWYAHILGIYHMETWLNVGGQPAKQCLEVLWVRWLVPPQTYKSGTKYAHLPKVAFVKESDPDAFRILDPRHSTSSLHYGKLLAHSVEELDDWEEHYMGIIPHLVITRDCLESMKPANAMDTVDDTNHEELADGDEGHEQFNDKDESSDELEDEGDGDGQDEDEDEDEDNFLSF
ncbi:hypothetical protein BDR04DRAFT_1122400 [Suillus decipiens]|nr:hypothetical protein BDR04DRAFT_1122400 [Suillus decipiens]